MASVADLLVERLARAGVDTLFGLPGGGGNLDVIEAAGRAGLRFVLTATETGSALAAVGHADVTGHPGACLTTLGPGVASVANGLACALLDRAPVLVITDSPPVAAGGAFEHQQVDHHGLLAPITRWSGRLGPDRIGETLDQAMTALGGLPPGPVHLDWPGDVADADEPPEHAGTAPDAPGDPSDPGPLAAAVANAARPIVIAGLGARHREDALALAALVERRGIPAMVTYKAKGVIADDHPCFAGVFTNARGDQALVDRSDLVIGVGLDPVELLPRAWPYQQPVVAIGPWRVSDRQVPFHVQHIASVRSGVQTLDETLPDVAWDLEAVRRHVEAQRRAIDVRGDGLTPAAAVRAAAGACGPDVRVTVDAGAHMFPVTTLWPVAAPGRMLISNGLSTMGFALPAAIGGALAEPDRPVVAVTGDAGLLVAAGELATLARERLHVTVVVFSDASLSLIEVKQQRRGYRPAGVAVPGVDWLKLADGFGLAPFAATTAEELAEAIGRAAATGGPSLIEARIDRSTYASMIEIIRG